MEFTNGSYHIQGVTFRQLSEKFGTPLYIYDADKIVAQINALRYAFQSISIKYAVKALSNLSVLKLMRLNPPRFAEECAPSQVTPTAQRP